CQRFEPYILTSEHSILCHSSLHILPPPGTDREEVFHARSSCNIAAACLEQPANDNAKYGRTWSWLQMNNERAAGIRVGHLPWRLQTWLDPPGSGSRSARNFRQPR